MALVDLAAAGDRLDPHVLDRDARKLLRRCTSDDERVRLVVSLLRGVRQAQDREAAIGDGYARSAKMEREMVQAEVEGIRDGIVAQLRRELRTGYKPPQQQETYEGGLRRAVRLVQGMCWTWRDG